MSSILKRASAAGVVGVLAIGCAALGVPGLGVVAVAAVAGPNCGPALDTVPPAVSDVTFSTTAVDTTNGPVPVTITADATDGSGNGAASGIKTIRVAIEGSRHYVETNLTLTSGSTTDGVWQGTVTIPSGVKSSTWQLQDVDATDKDGNSQDYSEYGYGYPTPVGRGTAHPTEAASPKARRGTSSPKPSKEANSSTRAPSSPTAISLQSGWDTQIAVTSVKNTPPKKRTAGKLTDLKVTATRLNTTKAAMRDDVTATFSAVQPKSAEVDFEGDRGGVGARLHHVSGGTWTGHVTFARWGGKRTYDVYVRTEYGNSVTPRFRDYQSDTLAAKGFPSEVKVTGAVDKTPPTLTGLSFSSSSADTVGAAADVTVTGSATDNLSGVSDVRVYFFHRSDDLYGEASANLHRVGSSSTWAGTAKFRQCIVSGDYKAEAFVRDVAGNERRYETRALAKAGYPDSIMVTSTPGDREDPEVNNATAAGLTSSISLDFSEGVKNVTSSDLSVFAESPASMRFQSTEAISAITCSDGSAVVACDGSGGGVTSAMLTVPSLQDQARYVVYANLNSVTSQLTDIAGNPLYWGYQAADVTVS